MPKPHTQNPELFTLYAATPSIRLRNQIAVANDRLALTIAHRQRQLTDTPIDDLEQLARQGLLKAIERFDPKSGNAFSSFAVPYIRGEIQHYLRDRRLIKVPRQWQEIRDKADNLARKMAAAGRPTTIDEAATAGLGLAPQDWEEIKGATACHLTSEIAEESIVAHNSWENLERSEELDEERAALCRAIATLPELHQSLITESYWGGMEAKHLAIRHSLTVDQVRRELATAIKTLRERILSDATAA